MATGSYPGSRKPNSGLGSLTSSITNVTAASATPPAATSPTSPPPHRPRGASSAIPSTVAPTKFNTNRVPMVGTAEYSLTYCCRCTAPTASSASATRPLATNQADPEYRWERAVFTSADAGVRVTDISASSLPYMPAGPSNQCAVSRRRRRQHRLIEPRHPRPADAMRRHRRRLSGPATGNTSSGLVEIVDQLKPASLLEIADCTARQTRTTPNASRPLPPRRCGIASTVDGRPAVSTEDRARELGRRRAAAASTDDHGIMTTSATS
jgi:hypothetical protein